MAELTNANMIWNRACGGHRLRSLPGDRALSDLLRAHNLAMNGGVLHAVECLAASELSDAAAGYQFYGLDPVTSLLSRAKQILEEGIDLEFHEDELDRQYAEIIPDDSTLLACFERHLKENPSGYASLRAIDTK